MQSIWDEQTIKPDEIVLVEDGILTKDLYLLIKKWKKKLGSVLKIIPLKKNVGLAKALNEGLKNCSYDIIARMDTDDIATPQRFEMQLTFLKENKNIDVVGTYISEIDENEIVINKNVHYPLTHKELYQFFRKRDPLAHPTTMFRKRFFKKAGNYPTHLLLAEDTLLWYNGFLQGCQFANLDFVGLKFRRSSEFYQRRANYNKSIGLLKYRLFKINRNLNFGIVADIYAVAYFIISVSPSFIKKILYKTLR
jgi:glycosyltransferase involved in cell wall biosynthesis